MNEAELRVLQHEKVLSMGKFVFPASVSYNSVEYLGITKRELFAAIFMHAFIQGPNDLDSHELCAASAVGAADSLMQALAK